MSMIPFCLYVGFDNLIVTFTADPSHNATILMLRVDFMGSLSVQPPSGLTRNLTEVYVFLRNNAQQQNAATIEFGGISGRDGGSFPLLNIQ